MAGLVSFVAITQVWLMLVLHPFSPKTIYIFILPTAVNQTVPGSCYFHFIDFPIADKKLSVL